MKTCQSVSVNAPSQVLEFPTDAFGSSPSTLGQLSATASWDYSDGRSDPLRPRPCQAKQICSVFNPNALRTAKNNHLLTMKERGFVL